jgi:hypothetical protein
MRCFVGGKSERDVAEMGEGRAEPAQHIATHARHAIA